MNRLTGRERGLQTDGKREMERDRKRKTEIEMVGCLHQCDGHEFE